MWADEGQTGEEDELIMTQREQEHNQIWAQEGENTTNSPWLSGTARGIGGIGKC